MCWTSTCAWIRATRSSTWASAEATLESPALLAGNNLGDLVDAVAARTPLGAVEVATAPVEGESTITTTPSSRYVLADATGGAVTVELYHHLTYGKQEIVVMKTDAGGNAVTVQADYGSAINGAATQVLSSQYDFLRLVPGSSGWFIVGN